MSIIGFDFTEGATVPSPADYHPGDYYPVPTTHHWIASAEQRARRETFQTCHQARKKWYDEIVEAVQASDAWGVLFSRPDGKITLVGVEPLMPQLWDGTRRGGSATLIVAREVIVDEAR